MLVGFLDECKSPKFALILVVLEVKDLSTARSIGQSMRLRGQRRIHFRNESDSRRRQYLALYADFNLSIFVIESPEKKNLLARRLCLLEVGRLAKTLEISRVVIEMDDSSVKLDSEVLSQANVRFTHLEPHKDACLWIPDAYGWVNQRGGSWTRFMDDARVEKIQAI